jgi:DNA integrity scanning protein DisA with diadenylate cyclase activity
MIMQEASFTNLFKTIMWIIAFYYIFKFLARIFLPVLVKKAVEKAGENFQRQQQYGQDNSWQKTRTNNDEIIINTANAKNPRETKKVGDYVDYEEID